MPQPSDEGIRSAIDKARQGDLTEIQLVLAQRCKELIAGLSTSIPRDLARSFDVEDLLQETCIRAMRAVCQCQFDSAEQFDAWLSEIARNCLIDAVRAGRRKKRGGGQGRVPLSWLRLEEQLRTGDPELETASQLVHVQQVVDDVRQAVTDLPERERKAVVLYYLRELEPGEAAQMMQVSPGAFRALLQRARQRLRTAMRESAWFPKK